MNIRIIKFRKRDYAKFLKLKINPKTKKDFGRSLFSYAREGVKSIIDRKRIYKFAVLDGKKFIGFASIMNISNFYEIRIFILKEYRNKGVATIVAKKLIDYSFKKLKFKKIGAVCDEDKKESIKILKKLGFKLIRKNEREKTLVWEKQK